MTYRAILGVLLVAGLMAGCAGAPPAPPVQPAAPPPSRLTPQEAALERALRDFYGAPYLSGGTTPAGVDCSGLVMAAYRRVGLTLPRTVADQYRQGQPVAPGRWRFGDVLFFNRWCQVKKSGPALAAILPPEAAREVCHNGIYLGHGRFIHASSQGVQVSSLDAEVWRVSYLGAKRYLSPPRP
jgi:cell wall-associated NlpC family hydrolase